MTDMSTPLDENIKADYLKYGLLIFALTETLAQVIAYSRRGETLTEQALAEIKEKALRYIKNVDVVGVSIEQEAEVGQLAFIDFDIAFASALSRSRGLSP